MDYHLVGGVSGSAKTQKRELKNKKYEIWALEAGMPIFHCQERPIVKENESNGVNFIQSTFRFW
jgi:hypothetical protein